MERILRQLYVQVLIAMAVGIVFGICAPELAQSLKPVADGFIKLIKMLLAPIIFGTVVTGIAKLGGMREVGRIGIKALVYFEVLSTCALAIGLAMANLFRPGEGMGIATATLDTAEVEGYAQAAEHGGVAGFFLDIIPDTIVGAFTHGPMLPVILVSVLFGFALSQMGEEGAPVVAMIDRLTAVVFRIVGFVMHLAPLGAGAGVAYTVGAYGVETLWSLGQLLITLYATTAFFIIVVLGLVARASGISLWRLLRYIRTEIFIVFGTCSTEAVLPQIMDKMERLGIARPVVGLVLPTGYAFNADGTSIYLTMAALFIAQATGTDLSLSQQLLILAIFLVTSKGSAGVAGAGFVALAATLSVFPEIPLGGLVLILGVDRFLNEARAVTNLIGNSVATIAVARWDRAIDMERARATLADPSARVQPE